MIATSAISPGEEILVVPAHLYFVRPQRSETAELANSVQRIATTMTFESQYPVYASWLLRELEFYSDQSHAQEFSWSVYLERLRRAGLYTLDWFWQPPEQLEKLRPSPEYHMVVAARKKLSNDHQKIIQNVPRSLLGEFTLDAFMNATLLLKSRAFATPQSGNVLVPILDNLDHATQHNIEYEGVLDQNAQLLSLRAWANRNIHPGEELFDSYGKKSNPELFRFYGLTVEPRFNGCC
eukprot:gnl/MRDRNA2_/MRDRNA2_37781_c0_seq1.p1 gnl/MRDRNA2_/MRDRNA2_37781_c0~~gnl/MRDRNA2_/MRDRNA2_37781_c0_seq1.p1  ORF type:complete len:278 (+),score=29.78 gnl/MRDRNA2_/MRDRNA2_37781_c0_seq1:126-836(+)